MSLEERTSKDDLLMTLWHLHPGAKPRDEKESGLFLRTSLASKAHVGTPVAVFWLMYELPNAGVM